jgi:uncharacterized membrane protein YdbT with pleckstrin-like domain
MTCLVIGILPCDCTTWVVVAFLVMVVAGVAGALLWKRCSWWIGPVRCTSGQ